MEELSPLEKLDSVLWTIEHYHGKSIQTSDEILIELNEHPDERINREQFYPIINSILNKLVEDGYIECRNEVLANKKNVYYIKFEGRIFNEQKGYTGQRDLLNATKVLEDTLKLHQKVSTDRMIYLTRVLAFGTGIAAVYYAIEVYKLLHVHYPCFFHEYLYWI
jgi:hypothetical protein